MQKLVLFDIDGTLVETGSHGKKGPDNRPMPSYQEALVKLCGATGNPEIYTEGKTETQLVREYMAANGIAESKEMFQKVIDEVVRINRTRPQRKEIPGARELVEKLAARGHVLGLLTGNLAAKAKAKLAPIGLWDAFQVGAFADGVFERNALGTVALSDAKEKTGKDFDKKDVWIVGDTVRDIACAKANGFFVISVATGKETAEELKAKAPDAVFADFSDTDAMVRAIEGK